MVWFYLCAWSLIQSSFTCCHRIKVLSQFGNPLQYLRSLRSILSLLTLTWSFPHSSLYIFLINFLCCTSEELLALFSWHIPSGSCRQQDSLPSSRRKLSSVSLSSYTLAPASEHRGLPQGSLWYLSTFPVLASPQLSTVLQCQRQGITSLDLQSRSTAQDMVVLLCRWGKLLTHAVFIVPQDPTSVPARLPLRALDHSPCYCIWFFQSRCGTWHLRNLAGETGWLQPHGAQQTEVH